MIFKTTPSKRVRIGDLLVEKAMISETQLQHALQEQKITGRKLGSQLVDLGYVGENELLNLLSTQLQIPFVELTGNQRAALSSDSVARGCRWLAAGYGRPYRYFLFG
jgi:hypothetical protein